MDTTFRRLYELLRCIPRSGKIGTSDLVRRLRSKGFKAYPRMVQRDLQFLANENLIACDGNSTHYGWHFPAGALSLPNSGMTAGQALSFHLVESYLRDLMPAQVVEDLRPYFADARTTLSDTALPSPLGRWLARIRVHQPEMPRLAPKVNRAVHATVTEALLLGRQLQLTYLHRNRRKEGDHRVHPLGLIQNGRVQYLAARFYEYDEARLLALHRISRAKMLDADAAPPDGFTLDGWLATGVMGFGGSGRPIRIRLEFSDGAGDHLLESPLASNQKAEEFGQGQVRVTATVHDTQQLRWWLLGFGQAVKVIGPSSLRREIAAELDAAVAQYAGDRPSSAARRAAGEPATRKTLR